MNPDPWQEPFPPDADRLGARASVPSSATADGPGTADGATAAESPTSPGEIAPIPGYRIVSVLGSGAFGRVYRAVEEGSGRDVALKVMSRPGPPNPEASRRFQNEARELAAVDHPHVVQVRAFGEHGFPYLVMEYCPGGTLADRLRGGPLLPRAAAALVAEVAAAVAVLHDRGIVHRDLKPENILFDAGGRSKVADFGVAKWAGGDDLTRTGHLIGTPAYMSPEQADGRAKYVGPEADVWALGVILYETLAGRRPFESGGAADGTGDPRRRVLTRILTGVFPRPRTVNPRVPRDLELICLKCLELDPGRRYRSAGELAADVLRWLAGGWIQARGFQPRPVASAVLVVGVSTALLLGLGVCQLSGVGGLLPLAGFSAGLAGYGFAMKWVSAAYRANPAHPLARRLEWVRRAIANRPLPGHAPDA
jgi:eukaryotic-like serine/threonine-protein kinase